MHTLAHSSLFSPIIANCWTVRFGSLLPICQISILKYHESFRRFFKIPGVFQRNFKAFPKKGFEGNFVGFWERFRELSKTSQESFREIWGISKLFRGFQVASWRFKGFEEAFTGTYRGVSGFPGDIRTRLNTPKMHWKPLETNRNSSESHLNIHEHPSNPLGHLNHFNP